MFNDTNLSTLGRTALVMAVAAMLALSAVPMTGLADHSDGDATIPTAGNTTTAEGVEITVTDNSDQAADDPYAVHIEVTNNNVDPIDVTDVVFNNSQGSVNGAVTDSDGTINSGETITIGTLAGGDPQADLNASGVTIDTITGGLELQYALNGTSGYSGQVSIDLDADGDLIPDSQDPYPTIAPTTQTHVVDDSNGDATALELNYSDDNTTADVTVMRYNETSGFFEVVEEYDLNTSESSIRHEFASQPPANGSEYKVRTHGTATVQSQSIDYLVDSDGDGEYDRNDAYPSDAPSSYLKDANTSKSNPQSYQLDYEGGTADVTVEAYNNSTATWEEIDTTSIDATSDVVNHVVSIPSNMSGDTDGDGTYEYTQYRAVVEGDGQVTDTYLHYEVLSGGSGGTSDASVVGFLTSEPIPMVPVPMFGILGLMLIAGLYGFERRDDM